MTHSKAQKQFAMHLQHTAAFILGCVMTLVELYSISALYVHIFYTLKCFHGMWTAAVDPWFHHAHFVVARWKKQLLLHKLGYLLMHMLYYVDEVYLVLWLWTQIPTQFQFLVPCFLAICMGWWTGPLVHHLLASFVTLNFTGLVLVSICKATTGHAVA
jgi:hypothetical protein